MTSASNRPSLPSDIVVFERGWLSSNNILLKGTGMAALVDSGYATHALQTVALASRALVGGRPLDLLVNTHLHSDHCGGNHALQQAYPALKTLIAPGQAEAVHHWDMQQLSFDATGQQCPRFDVDGLVRPGDEIELGARRWEVHAAGGHDEHAVLLFEPSLRLMITADALWETGFGVVFPELDGRAGFDAVAATLDLIERLAPATAIPGHGAVFSDVAQALRLSRARLAAFVREPERHARHAAKVLIKFALLERQVSSQADLYTWAARAPYLRDIRDSCFPDATPVEWFESLLDELVRAGAAERQGQTIVNATRR